MSEDNGTGIKTTRSVKEEEYNDGPLVPVSGPKITPMEPVVETPQVSQETSEVNQIIADARPMLMEDLGLDPNEPLVHEDKVPTGIINARNRYNTTLPPETPAETSSGITTIKRVDATPNIEVMLNGQLETVTLVDGDTAYTASGKRLRFTGLNTAETTVVTDFGIKSGTDLGQLQAEQIYKIISEGGFNILTSRKLTAEQQERNYGGDLVDVANAAGNNLGDYLIANDVVKPTNFTSNEAITDRQLNKFMHRMQGYSQVNTTTRASDLVNHLLSTSPSFTQGLATTREERLQYSPSVKVQTEAGPMSQIDAHEIKLANLELLMENPELSEGAIEDLRSEHAIATEAYQVALNAPKLYYSSVEEMDYRYVGRGSNWGDETWNSLGNGAYGLATIGSGITQWLGDITGAEGIEQTGKDWGKELDELYTYDSSTVGLDDIWDWNDYSLQDKVTIGQGGQFITNTIAEFAPQLGLLIASRKAISKTVEWGAILGSRGRIKAPAAKALGELAGKWGQRGLAVIMGTSGVYNAQAEGDKKPWKALGFGVAIGAVDVLGLSKGALAGVNVLSKEGQKIAIKALLDGGKATTEAGAKKLLLNSITTVMKEANLEIAQHAAKQLIAKKGLKDLAFLSVKGIGKEGATEGFQGILEGIAEQTDTRSLAALDYEQLFQSFAENAVLGGIASGPFSLQGAVTEVGAVNQFYYENAEASDTRTLESKFAEAEVLTHSGTINKQQIAQHANAQTTPKSAVRSDSKLKGLKDNYSDKDKATLWKDFKGVISNPKNAFGAYKKNIFRKFLQNTRGEVNPWVGRAASLLDSIRTHAGTSVPKQIEFEFNNVHNPIASLQEVYQKAGVKTINEWNALQDKPNKTADEQAAINTAQEGFKQAGANLVDLYTKLGIVDQLPVSASALKEGWLGKTGYFHPEKLDANFVKALAATKVGKGRRSREIGQVEAEKIKKDIQENSNVGETMDFLIQNGILDNPQFANYRGLSGHQAATSMIAALVPRAVKSATFGRNGETLSKMYHLAKESGEISEEGLRELSAKTQDVLDAIDGRLGEDLNKYHAWALNNSLLLTQLAYMDLNFFSNVGDIAINSMKLSNGEYKKYFWDYATGFTKLISNDIKGAGRKITGNQQIDTMVSQMVSGKGNSVTDNLLASGIRRTDGQSDIATLEGTNTTGKAHKLISEFLFKINLVAAQTDAARGAIGGFAMNHILKYAEAVRQSEKRGFHTEDSRRAQDMLNYYGVDGQVFVRHLDKFETLSAAEANALDPASPDLADLLEQYQVGLTNYIDEFSARPEAASGWKILEKRGSIRLFTQFKRFISHFTSNQIPHLWNFYVARGGPKTTYSVFKGAMIAVLMTSLAQQLKEVIKNGLDGDDDDEIEDFNDAWNSIYGKAVKYTGLLGTPEMILDAYLDYNNNTRRDSRAGKVFDLITGQAPVLGTLKGLIEADYSEDWGQERPIRLIPFVGDIKATREYFRDLAFNGE